MSRSTNNKMSRTLVRNHVSRLQHSVGLYRIRGGGRVESAAPLRYIHPQRSCILYKISTCQHCDMTTPHPVQKRTN